MLESVRKDIEAVKMGVKSARKMILDVDGPVSSQLRLSRRVSTSFGLCLRGF